MQEMSSPSRSGRRRHAVAVALAAAAALAAVGCGKAGPQAGSSTSAGGPSGTALVATTPAATSDVDRVTWALYRETSTLDPIYAFDTPDNTVLATLCDSLMRQRPDGTIVPGLAASYTYRDPTTIVLGIRAGVHFWDGSALTAADVVYSLDRQRDPKLGSLYGPAFARVRSVEATGPLQVTIKLSKPDYWLRGEALLGAGNDHLQARGPGPGAQVRDAGRHGDVHRAVQARIVEAG